MTPRQRALLKSFNEREVRYVVIGALAFPSHGYTRTTYDIDIFFEPTIENARRLRLALLDFGFPVHDIPAEELLPRKTLFRHILPETDLHPYVAGATWPETWQRRKSETFEGVTFSVPSLEDLLAMKRAAGRPKDVADLQMLEEVKRQRDFNSAPAPGDPAAPLEGPPNGEAGLR